MNFVRLKYNGKKPYTDRTPLKTRWGPGDEKLIPEPYARKGVFALLKFAEFSEVKAEQPTEDGAVEQKANDELEQAHAQLAAVQSKKADEDRQRENMLLEVGTWEKDALIEYAAKYDTKLDKRKSESALRQQVSNLVEQFGVR